MKVGHEYLSKTRDNIERGTYLMIHILDKFYLTTVGLELELIGIIQFFILLLQLSIDIANNDNIRRISIWLF